MINGLGVLGWGVGGIEAEAAMLGQPISMLVPQVVGFGSTGSCREGATATDLVLTVTEMLRKTRRRRQVRRVLRPRARGAAARRPRDDREHGARVRRDVRLLPGRRRDARATCASPAGARSASRSSRRTARSNVLWHDDDAPSPTYSQVVELDLGDGRAEPRRPAPAAGPRPARATRRTSFRDALDSSASATATARSTRASRTRSRRATRPRPGAGPTRRAGAGAGRPSRRTAPRKARSRRRRSS